MSDYRIERLEQTAGGVSVTIVRDTDAGARVELRLDGLSLKATLIGEGVSPYDLRAILNFSIGAGALTITPPRRVGL